MLSCVLISENISEIEMQPKWTVQIEGIFGLVKASLDFLCYSFIYANSISEVFLCGRSS